MKITLGLATNRGFRPKTTACLLEMVNYSKDIDFHVCLAEKGYTIAENRNYIVVQAERNESDYILMVDDDMTFGADTLEKLLANGKEVVGVNSYSRVLPLSSTVGMMDKNGKYMHPDYHMPFEMKIPDELFKAYFVGCGVCLIDMKVFKKIKKPYFEFTTHKTGLLKGMVEHGEDGNFCRKIKEAGMDVWCNPTIEVGHLGELEYKKQNGI